MQDKTNVLRQISKLALSHFWFKTFGITGFMVLFFSAYIYLLKNPAYPVTIIPATRIDRLIGFEPQAVFAYLSLWLYVSLPPLLMPQRQEIVEYGRWIGGLCLTGLTVFYFWPSAIPPTQTDWSAYPEMGFLKSIDTSGNACPSLHVASAGFSAFWLHWKLPQVGLGNGFRLLNMIWCLAIIYSTMATKQHMLFDVLGGIVLASTFAWFFLKSKSVKA